MANEHNDIEIEQFLYTLFFRKSCPEPEALEDYFLNDLPPSQRLVVALHMRKCPHCKQELSLYAEETPEPQGFFEILEQAVARVLWATKRSEPQLANTVRGRKSVRRDSPAANKYADIYDVEGNTITVYISPAQDGIERFNLFGELEPEEAATKVELWRPEEAEPHITQQVTDGVFDFSFLQTGTYYLCLKTDNTDMWIEQEISLIEDGVHG